MASASAEAQTAASAPQPFIEELRQQERERALREQQERPVALITGDDIHIEGGSSCSIKVLEMAGKLVM